MLRNLQQTMMGRTPLRYHFEVVPHYVEGLPEGVQAVSVVWEKGTKICYTEPALVDPETRCARFHEIMRQSATLYRTQWAFVPKDFTFKVQSMPVPVPGSKRRARRGRVRTLARALVDLAAYAAPGPDAETHRIEVMLDGAGSKCILHLSVRGVWLQHLGHGSGRPGEAAGSRWGDGASTVSDVTGGGSVGGGPRLSRRVSFGNSSMEDGVSELPGPSEDEVGAYHSTPAFMDVMLGLAPQPGIEEASAVAQPQGGGVAAGELAGATGNPNPFLASVASEGAPGAHAAGPRKPPAGRTMSASAAMPGPRLPALSRLTDGWEHEGVGGDAGAEEEAAAAPAPAPEVRRVASATGAVGGLLAGAASAVGGLVASAYRTALPTAASAPLPSQPEAAAEGDDAANPTGAQAEAAAQPGPGQGEAPTMQQVQPAPVAPPPPPAGVPVAAATASAASAAAASAAAGAGGSQHGAADAAAAAGASPRRPALRLRIPSPAGASGSSTPLQLPQAVPSGQLPGPLPGGGPSSGGGSGPERAYSGPLPAWMWPHGRAAVRGVPTEELTRMIAAAPDAGELQRLARGLLAERNDWRESALQWEATARDIESQLVDAHRGSAALAARIEGLEQQLAELQDESMLDYLVAAKLAAAQHEFEATELKGALQMERERTRELAVRLTGLQERYESLLNKTAAAAAAAATGSSGAASPATAGGTPASGSARPLPLPPASRLPSWRSAASAGGASTSQQPQQQQPSPPPQQQQQPQQQGQQQAAGAQQPSPGQPKPRPPSSSAGDEEHQPHYWTTAEVRRMLEAGEAPRPPRSDASSLPDQGELLNSITGRVSAYVRRYNSVAGREGGSFVAPRSPP